MKEAGETFEEIIKKIIKQLFKHLKQYEVLETADRLKRIDATKIKKRLNQLSKAAVNVAEKKIRHYAKITYKNGLRASVSQNGTPKRILPKDVRVIKRNQAHWLKEFKSLSAEMKRDITRIVDDGLRDNVDPRTIKDRIKNLFKTHDKGKVGDLKQPKTIRLNYRANMIGRSMIVDGYNNARYERDKMSGIIWGKEWVAAEDERTCIFCGGYNKNGSKVNKNPLNGQKVALEDYFETTYKGKTIRVKHPKAHIQCRCTYISITYVNAKKMGLI